MVRYGVGPDLRVKTTVRVNSEVWHRFHDMCRNEGLRISEAVEALAESALLSGVRQLCELAEQRSKGLEQAQRNADELALKIAMRRLKGEIQKTQVAIKKGTAYYLTSDLLNLSEGFPELIAKIQDPKLVEEASALALEAATLYSKLLVEEEQRKEAD